MDLAMPRSNMYPGLEIFLQVEEIYVVFDDQFFWSILRIWPFHNLDSLYATLCRRNLSYYQIRREPCIE